MRLVPLAAACAVLLSLGPTATAGRTKPPANPSGLKPFLVRVSEAPQHVFSRTPSFAWKPVRNAASYEFELATSPSFNGGTVIWSSDTLKTPAVSVPVALPWITGNPYALWAHVRAVSPTGGTSDWSQPFGFNLRWTSRPTKLPGDEYPGLVQWTMVAGASAYDVWWVDAAKVIRTRTNVADEREYYTFHQNSPWPDVVHWRVRAVRKTYGKLPNGMPTVSYGPWSDLQTSTNGPLLRGPLTTLDAVSDDATSDADTTAAHRLTPGFVFGGTQSLALKSAPLYRVYVASDEDCVNIVFKGALVGSPAYAPRSTGPLALPGDSVGLDLAGAKYLPDGLEGRTLMADTSTVLTTESDKPLDNSDTASDDPASTPSPTDADPSLPSTPQETGAPIDLWDSGYPNGRYYWTVVPAEPVVVPALSTYLASAAPAGATVITVKSTKGFSPFTTVSVGTGSTQEAVQVQDFAGNLVTLQSPLKFSHAVNETVIYATNAIEYRELDTPQDACAAGRVQTFGKVSEPVVTGNGSPFATGLSPQGRLVQAASSRPSFYGSPLVTWTPALGADEYQVQWSPTQYPWRPLDPKTKERYERFTYATSTLLDRAVKTGDTTARGPLPPGTWWYRVRGIDFALPGTARAMSWSDPVMVRVAKPVFTISK
jgi:hypothetical protein